MSKDEDAKWVKKAGRLTPLLDESPEGVELLADKGYASKSNRNELGKRGLKDGIMHKAVRGRPITADEQKHNNEIKTKR